MSVKVSQVIDRPAADVFQFVAVDHVRNHPRWDTKMELEQLSEGPIRVGTIVRRRHTHAGYPIDGTMECVEFEPPRAMAWLVHEGQVEMRARIVITPEGPDRSKLTGSIDIEGAVEPLDPGPIVETLRRIKELIESEG
jgi:hypothetical protein